MAPPGQRIGGMEDPVRVVAFAKRKKLLLKKAMELSVLCDCNVALIIFDPDGKLVQYSSADAMDQLLEQYAEACQHPHERHTNEDLFKEHYADLGKQDDHSTAALTRKRMLEMGVADAAGAQQQQQQAPCSSGPAVHVEGIRPAGFMDDKKYPVSPRSEKAYNEITAQFELWTDGVNNRSSRAETHQEAGPGPGSDAGDGGNGGKRFKSLSIMVPEMPAHPLMRHAVETAGGLDPGLHGGPPSLDLAGHHLAPGQSLSDGMMGLAMPSPGNMLFGLPSDGLGLFTSRGGLNLGLGLDTLESDRHMSHDRGLDWPTNSPDRDSMLPGFSDDGESGEELQGDMMMVTGRSIQPAGQTAGSPEAGSERRGRDVGNSLDGLLMVSGVNLGGSAGQGSREKAASVEFPGFASPAEAGSSPRKAGPDAALGAISDIPFDI